MEVASEGKDAHNPKPGISLLERKMCTLLPGAFAYKFIILFKLAPNWKSPKSCIPEEYTIVVFSTQFIPCSNRNEWTSDVCYKMNDS